MSENIDFDGALRKKSGFFRSLEEGLWGNAKEKEAPIVKNRRKVLALLLAFLVYYIKLFYSYSKSHIKQCFGIVQSARHGV